MSQRLDSLRRDFFLFKGTAWAATIRAVAEISECKTYASQRLDSLRCDFLYKGADRPHFR